MPKPLFLLYNIVCVDSTFENGPPKKRVQKQNCRPSCIKKSPPPPARLLTFPFGDIKKSAENRVFRFSRSRFLAHFPSFLFWFFRPRKIIRQISATLSGLPKNRGKQGFLWSCATFFNSICYILFPIFSMWCPYARVSLRVTSSLQMSDSSLLSYLFLLFSFCSPLCFFFRSFYINHFNLSAPHRCVCVCVCDGHPALPVATSLRCDSW